MPHLRIRVLWRQRSPHATRCRRPLGSEINPFHAAQAPHAVEDLARTLYTDPVPTQQKLLQRTHAACGLRKQRGPLVS